MFETIPSDTTLPRPESQMAALLGREAPVLALAPMQDVTDLPFWRLISQYGGPDLYFTEYFRVHGSSTPEKWILQSIVENPTGRPAVAQLIGNDIDALARTAKILQRYPVAGIDLNLGCPAPVVYRKCAGGGLLRDPARIDRLLAALRDAVHVNFSVKTRLGFSSPEEFQQLLPVFAKHRLDLLSVHGRTVEEMYRSKVHYEWIAEAARSLPFPVLANGNISSPANARAVLRQTSARGLMIGRGAIRNPWIFSQIRQLERGEAPRFPTGRDVLKYVHELWDAIRPPQLREHAQVQKMKKYMNFIGLGVEPTGRFLHDIRRATSESQFFSICEHHLDHGESMNLEPFAVPLPDHDILAGAHTEV